jgi:cobalt-zinc-cadmium efflux system outer membrane protein
MRRPFRRLLVTLALLFGASAALARIDTAPAAPALRSLLTNTLETNPEMAAAQARLEAAQALAQAANRPYYNPELELEVENAETHRATVGLAQTLDWGNKRGARTSVAQFERDSAQAEVAALRLGLSRRLLVALADAEVDNDLAELQKRRVAQTSELLRLTQRRFQAGDIPHVDAYLAELADAQARGQAAGAGSSAAEARAAVTALTGRRVQELAALPADPPLIVPGRVDEAMLAQLPRQRALRALVDAAQAGVTLKQRERRPDPTLRLAGGREGDANVTMLALSIPLPVRNPYRYEVVAAQAQAEGAADQLAADLRQARAAWLAAGERYVLTRDAWLAWRTGSRVSTDRLEATLHKLWQVGELSTGDYLTQLAQAVEAQASGLELKRAVWHAYGDWLEASGGSDGWLLVPAEDSQGERR